MPKELPSQPSTSAIDAEKTGGFFPATAWHLIAEVGRPNASEASVNEFAERYHVAVLSFINAIVRNRSEAEELTQKFFLTAVLSGRVLRRVDRSQGSFRAYLKQSIRNFLIDEHRKRTRKRHSATEASLHPDGMKGGWDHVARTDSPSHDAAFLRGWAQSVVTIALKRVSKLCDEQGQQTNFQLFVGRFLSPGDDLPSWRELGEPLNLDEKVARSRAETVAGHFRKAVRELVASEAGVGDRTDEEILQMICML